MLYHRKPFIFDKRPPTGIGIQLCDRNITQRWFVWWRGHIEQFCSTLPEAVKFIGALADGGALPS